MIKKLIQYLQSPDNRRLFPELFKSFSAALLSLIMLAIGAFAWFNPSKIPNALDSQINDTSAFVTVEQFDQEGGFYSLLYQEQFNDLGHAVIPVTLPEMTFYKWEGIVLSSVTENLFYKITLTGRFNPDHFSTAPELYILPRYRVETTNSLMASIKIIQADYMVYDSSQGPAPSHSFPDSNLSVMPLETNLTQPLIFPHVDVVNVSGTDRFQSVIYLAISPDTVAVAGIIDQLGFSLEGHTGSYFLTLSMGFRSTPYYVPEPDPLESSIGEDNP